MSGCDEAVYMYRQTTYTLRAPVCIYYSDIPQSEFETINSLFTYIILEALC